MWKKDDEPKHSTATPFVAATTPSPERPRPSPTPAPRGEQATIGRSITIAHPDTWGVTAELSIRYLHPIPVDAPIRAVARVTRDTSRLFEGTGEILLGDGTVAAAASGKYVRLALESIADPAFRETDWFPDTRERPSSADI